MKRDSVRSRRTAESDRPLRQGSLISPRVTDARRAVLLSSTRKLQTSAQLMDVKKQQDEFKRKLEKLDDQRQARPAP